MGGFHGRPAYADVDAGVANENSRLHPMPHVRRFDHVGITVADLDRAMAFFVGLGLEAESRMFLEGQFVDTVTGIPDSRSRDRHAAAAKIMREQGLRARAKKRRKHATRQGKGSSRTLQRPLSMRSRSPIPSRFAGLASALR